MTKTSSTRREVETRRDPPGALLSSGQVPDFFAISAPLAARLFRPTGLAYAAIRAHVEGLGRLGVWLVRDDLLFFLIAGIGILTTAPVLAVRVQVLVDRFVLGLPAAATVVTWWPWFPSGMLPLFALALLVYFLDFRWRLAALAAGALVFGRVLDSRADTVSLLVFAAFLALVYGTIKLRVRRSFVVSVVSLLSVVFMALCTTWAPLAERPVTVIVQTQITMLPMLWYSVYQESPPKRELPLWQFLVYHYTRFFNAPVVTYQDLFERPRPETLSRVRFSGVKALYVAILAGLVSWGVGLFQPEIAVRHATGLPLLGVSYLTYLAGYCQFIVVCNTFIGVARLFGLPVRDNFNYWLFARTPNEHWQRWNILFREWVITFVFFPVMRARRWLFVAVMSSLMTSGLLYVLWMVAVRDPDWFRIGLVLAYWFANGLAIYAVLKLPMLFPGAVSRLRIRTSPLWWPAGVFLTSAFYAVIFHVRVTCGNWEDVTDYFGRLVGIR